MGLLLRALDRLTACLRLVSMSALCALILLVCANVLARPLGHPFIGTYELGGFLGAITIAFALADNARIGGNIRVDFIVKRMPARTRFLIYAFGDLICLTICGFTVVAGIVQATTWWRSGQLSQTLQLPIVHVIAYAIAGCFAILWLTLLCDFAASMRKAFGK